MTASYRPEYQPCARDVRATFADEIRSLGGRVTDEFEDDDRYIGRALLDAAAEIRRGDVVEGGIAVRAGAAEILVHPYTFRVVCTNGAIVAHALGTRRIERVECVGPVQPAYEIAQALADVADAVRACADPDSFMSVAAEMRTAAEADADAAIAMAAVLSRWPQHLHHLLPTLFERFDTDGDRSVFGVMNAATAVAREVRDPDARWELERLGGECLATGHRSRKPLTHATLAGARLAG